MTRAQRMRGCFPEHKVRDLRLLAEDALHLLVTCHPDMPHSNEARCIRDVIMHLRAGLPPTFDRVAHVGETA